MGPLASFCRGLVMARHIMDEGELSEWMKMSATDEQKQNEKE